MNPTCEVCSIVLGRRIPATRKALRTDMLLGREEATIVHLCALHAEVAERHDKKRYHLLPVQP